MTTLKENTQKLITEVIGNDRSTQGKWKLMTDALVSDGVKSNMLDKPSKKTDANPNATLQFSITQAITKGLPVTWQSLLTKETKSLSESDKQEKRYAQQQLGSYYGKIKRHLLAFENPKENAPRVTRTSQQRIIDALNEAIDVAQKDDELNFDVPKFIKDIKASIALVK
jgi:hypothetical protein